VCAPVAPGWLNSCARAEVLGLPAPERSRVGADGRATPAAGRRCGGAGRRACRGRRGRPCRSVPWPNHPPRSGAVRPPRRTVARNAGAWRPTGGRPVGQCPAANFFSRALGLRARRRGTRGGDDPAGVPCAQGAQRSGRTVTQKHRLSTLRSTSGGCLPVTRREDCGRVPSKRRCRGVRIMAIAGRHALRLRILTPRSERPGPSAPLPFMSREGSRAIGAREVSPRGWVMSGWRAARPGSLRGRGRPRSRRVLHRMC
jgi:hypothetical protein